MTTAASPGTLAAAWPELQADPARAAAYAAAVEGLDPAAVAAVSDALRREGRPLPTPGVLRVAVLARAPRSPAGPPPPLQPPPPPAAPRARAAHGPRDVSDIVAMTILGVTGFFTIGGPTVAWVRSPSGATLTGTEAFGGFMSAAGFTAFAIAVIGAFYLWRRRSPRHLLQAYLLSAVVFCVTTVVAIGAYAQITEVPGLRAEPAYWSALGTVVAGAGVAIWRCLATWRRCRAEGGLGRAAISFAALTVALGLGMVGIYAAAYHDRVPSTAPTQPVETTASPGALATGRGAPTLGEARREYIAFASHQGAEMQRALAALDRATRQADPVAALDGMQVVVRSLESARNGLGAARVLNRPPFAMQTGRLVAGLDAQAHAARRLLDSVLAGRAPSQEEVATMNAADRRSIAADRDLRAALGIPTP